MLNSLRTLNLLNYIKKNLEVNIRKFGEGEFELDPPIQPGDLIHKSSCLYALVLPKWHRFSCIQKKQFHIVKIHSWQRINGKCLQILY